MSTASWDKNARLPPAGDDSHQAGRLTDGPWGIPRKALSRGRHEHGPSAGEPSSPAIAARPPPLADSRGRPRAGAAGGAAAAGRRHPFSPPPWCQRRRQDRRGRRRPGPVRRRRRPRRLPPRHRGDRAGHNVPNNPAGAGVARSGFISCPVFLANRVGPPLPGNPDQVWGLASTTVFSTSTYRIVLRHRNDALTYRTSPGGRARRTLRDQGLELGRRAAPPAMRWPRRPATQTGCDPETAVAKRGTTEPAGGEAAAAGRVPPGADPGVASLANARLANPSGQPPEPERPSAADARNQQRRRFVGPAVRRAPHREAPGHGATGAPCVDTICHSTGRRSCRPASSLG
jgi:hypothetical protein